MNNRELEVRLLNLERQVLAIANREGIRGNKAEENISSVDGRITETNAKVETNEETLSDTENALDFITESVLPMQDERVEELENSLDYLLTTILPEMGME